MNETASSPNPVATGSGRIIATRCRVVKVIE
jgi:hypothetical protein